MGVFESELATNGKKAFRMFGKKEHGKKAKCMFAIMGRGTKGDKTWAKQKPKLDS